MKVFDIPVVLCENSYAVIELLIALIKPDMLAGGAEHAIWHSGIPLQAVTNLLWKNASVWRSASRPWRSSCSLAKSNWKHWDIVLSVFIVQKVSRSTAFHLARTPFL